MSRRSIVTVLVAFELAIAIGIAHSVAALRPGAIRVARAAHTAIVVGMRHHSPRPAAAHDRTHAT